MSSNMRIKKVCQHCNKVFTAKTTVTKFCSDDCAKANYKKRMKKVRIEESTAATSRELLAENTTSKELPSLHNESKGFISLPELAATTRLSERTLYRLMGDSEFPRLKIGRRLLFNRESVLNYITSKYGNL
jgi:excisionase family DNA binding protein